MKTIQYRSAKVVGLLITLLWISSDSFGQKLSEEPLAERLQQIIDTSGAKVGVAVTGLDFPSNIHLNDNRRYPMQSVFKFPLALAVLNQVDKGQLSLTQIIHIPQESLDTATWSPLVKKYPHQSIDIALGDLLRYTVSQSDNNGCDALFNVVGGTKVVNEYLKSIGITYINIAATESEMRKRWGVQYTNWSEPTAMAQILQLFFDGSLLSRTNHDFLMKIMTESENAGDRIKGLLPQGTVVAHKTGTSDISKAGLVAATNDVGIITLPNGRHYALVVFVADYNGKYEKGASIIAAISKTIWDYYIHP
jgi:beta-lactamase class A